jgi:myosin-6
MTTENIFSNSRRICVQSPLERNYHIFYELLMGLDTSQKTQLGLSGKTPSSFNYLSRGCVDFFGEALRDPIVHDRNDFINLEKSFKNLQITQTSEIYKIVSIVLHIGNIDFIDDVELTSKGGCKVDPTSEATLSLLCELMKLDKTSFVQSLTSRVMQTAKGGSKGTVIMVPLKKYEASAARDALAKSIYNRLFDWIVGKINESIPLSKNKTNYIGVLDIAGFEYFTVNSFEQFCINYCNEKLQQFFNERVLHDEQELYSKEQLNVKKIEYVDNSDCIEMIEGRPGILALLDEESKLPKPSSSHFTSEVHTKCAHFRLVLPRKSKVKEHREILDNEGFIVRHFAGAVCYETKAFLEKNNDALHFGLEVLVQDCGNGFLKKLFGSIDVGERRGKLGFVSVAGKFKSQLGELLEKLRSTGTSFVRCVKPNSKMVQGVFEGGMILSQLQCAGMTSVLELMQRVSLLVCGSFCELFAGL